MSPFDRLTTFLPRRCLLSSSQLMPVRTRPGLSKQQRSLLNIGMLMALNRAPELAVHIRGARNNGLSELEIREAIIHATTYCGVPAGVDAMKTAEKVLNDMAEKGEMARELGNKSERA